jgi:hypothetical protein
MKKQENNPKTLGDLVGRVPISVGANEDDTVFELVCKDGWKLTLCHDRDCCEDVYLEDVVGSVEDLLDTPVLEASERSNETHDREAMSLTRWTFYHLVTAKGSVTLRWCGESNGYYSVAVNEKWSKAWAVPAD